MHQIVPGFAARFAERLESKCAAHGLAYPWWIILIGAGGQLLCAVGAVAQRDALLPPTLLAGVIVLVAIPHVAQFVAPVWLPWWVNAGFVLSGVLWLSSVSTGYVGPENLAPAVAAFLAASVTATDGARAGLLTLVAGIVVLAAGEQIGGPDAGLWVPALELVVGFEVGYMLRWQTRALAAERSGRIRERERATLAERQRIAREIHDLVAHSLSVTMLHVGGARQALLAGDDDRPDVDDALAALADAESVGREAMAEIRRTVGVLATGKPATSSAHPLPCAEDIPGLVGQLRDAGLPVSYDERGDLATLPAAAGLGFYRVLQEALTNATKHAPGEPVTVSVDVGHRQAHLVVRNPRVGDDPVSSDGSGTPGMTSRAEQLGGTLLAGPDPADPGAWLVNLSIPVGGPSPTCAVRKALR